MVEISFGKRNGWRGLRCIEAILVDPDSWEPEPFKFIFAEKDEYSWTSESPVLYFKTRKGIGFKTGYRRDISVKDLPPWGTAEEVRRRYLL